MMIWQTVKGIQTRLVGSKLGINISWSMIAFLVLGLSGLAINLVIIWFRETSDLGVFNQAYAIYVVASQIAAFGIHYSVMRHVAYHDDSPVDTGEILGSAFVTTLIMGVLVGGIVGLSGGVIAELLSPEVAEATKFTAFGLVLFPLSKAVISYFNGLQDMRMFATLQIVRYVSITVWVAVVSAGDFQFALSALCFVIGEIALLVVATFVLLRRYVLQTVSFSIQWLWKHMSFGSKSLMAGLVTELNTRVDVLCLGFFLSDATVGIYSFVIILIDGLMHIFAVLRVNFNPVIVVGIRDKNWTDLQGLLRTSMKFVPAVTGALGALILLAFTVFSFWVVPEKNLQNGLHSLIILLVGVTVVSAFIPFDNIPLAGGHPGFQTLQQVATVLVNFFANIVLIPLFGIGGAALATAISYVSGVLVLIVLTRYLFGWDLFRNKVTA